MADISGDKMGVDRFQNVSSVMVWGTVSKKEKLSLLFIDKGVQINAEYYLSGALKSHFAKTLFGDEKQNLWGTSFLTYEYLTTALA